MIGDRAAVSEGRRPCRRLAALEAIAGHIVEEDRVDIARRACGNHSFGLGMDQVRDRPAGEAREQIGEGFGVIGVAARQDEKAARSRHAILRIILP